jgi:hypothetical protein
MTTEYREFYIGSRGWEFRQWQNAFYPDGLPADWRFSYYSNEFGSVLVPWEYLPAATPHKTRAWLGDTDQRFMFFVEVALHLSWEFVIPVIEPLAPQLGGILLRDVRPEKTALIETAKVESLMRKSHELAPLIADRNELDSHLQELAASYVPGCYWRPDESGIASCRADIALAETTLTTKHHPKSLKKIIEDCRSVQGPTTIGFFIGGEAPNMEDLRNASAIWQMLG